MARVYPSAILDLTLNYLTDDIRVTLLNTTAAYNRTHQFLSSLAATEVTGVTRTALTGKTRTDNGTDRIIWAANGLTFSGVTSGQTVGSLVVYKEGASDAARSLIVWHDLPDTLSNGTDINIIWNPDGILIERY